MPYDLRVVIRLLWGVAVTADMIAPAWMHELVTAEQYDSWAEEQCAGIEIVDGMVVLSPTAPKRHHWIATLIAMTFNQVGRPKWKGGTDFDVRLRDIPLLNRRPDVVVYRAETIDITPTRPRDVPLVAEVVAPGSETTDRHTKPAEYAQAGIRYYWRIESIENGVPVAYTYVLDDASGQYRDAGVFTRVIKTDVPFHVEIDLEEI